MRARPKTFQFCNFQSVGAVIMRRSVWNVTGAPSDRSRHTQREQFCNRGNRRSGSFHQVGFAEQVLYKRPGSMCHTDDPRVGQNVCAEHERVVVSVARRCQPLVGQRSCETVRFAGTMGAGGAFSVMVSQWKSGVVSCSICCVGCPPPASPSTDAPGSPRAGFSATSKKSQTSLTLEERTPHASWRGCLSLPLGCLQLRCHRLKFSVSCTVAPFEATFRGLDRPRVEALAYSGEWEAFHVSN